VPEIARIERSSMVIAFFVDYENIIKTTQTKRHERTDFYRDPDFEC